MRNASQISVLALILAAGLAASPARAGSTTVTQSDANVLNLLSPFLTLNTTSAGQATLTSNLNQAIATNNAAANSPAIQAESISEKTIFSGTSTSITLANNALSYYGPGANLAGGLPAQAVQNGQSFSGSGNLTVTAVNGTVTPAQSVGGLGNLGAAFQTAVSPNAVTAGTSAYVTSAGTGANSALTGQYNTQNIINLLVNAYNFNSTDLGVAKYFFANGTANGTSTAVAPTGSSIPSTTAVGSSSVYDMAYGVSITQANQDVYGDSRPVQVAAGKIDQYDPNAITGLTTNPSFPSGHTTYAFTDSILIGMMSPQNFQSMLLAGSEYGNSRIDLGVHYPLDIIASRSFVQFNLVQLLSATAATGSTQATNPYYYTNANGSTTVLNLNGQFVSAATSLNGYLGTQTSGCGGSITACAATNPYNTYSATTYAYQAAADGVTGASASAENAAIYAYRLTYGLPTYTYAQAPREMTDTTGLTAAILLSTVYGGQGNAQAQALANAANGGSSGAGSLANLTTGTINQIIYNTEGQALQAFYGTQLSYWSRINLYAAAGYFSGVTGALTLASADQVNTAVTVSSGGSLGGAGTITGGLTYQSGATLTATPGATLTVHGGAVALQSGASVALSGNFLPGSYTLVSADSGQSISLGSVSVTGSMLSYEKASLAVTGDPVLSLTLTSNLAGVAQTPNQSAVAAAIDAAATASSFASNSAGQALYAGLINAGAGAFDALGGAGRVEANTAALQTGFEVAGAIAGQADFGLSGSGPDATGVTHFLAYAGEPTTKSPIVVKGPLPERDRDWRVWGEFLGAGATISGDAARGTPGSTSSTFGGLAGLDYMLQRNWLVGVALGGAGTHYNVSALASSGDVSSFNAGIYTAYGLSNGYYLEGSETFGSYRTNGARTVAIGGLTTQTLNEGYNSFEARTHLEFGRKLNIDGYLVTPFIAGEIASLSSPGYTESVAGGGTSPFALSTLSKTTMSTPLFLGFKFNGNATVISGWTATPDLGLAWVHEFSPNRTATGALAALPGADFTVAGPRAASDLAQIKAGLQLTDGQGVTLFAKFQGEFGDRATYYGGQAGFKYAF